MLLLMTLLCHLCLTRRKGMTLETTVSYLYKKKWSQRNCCKTASQSGGSESPALLQVQCRDTSAFKATSPLHIPSSSSCPLPLQNFCHYLPRAFALAVILKLYHSSWFLSFFMLLCYFFSTLLLLIPAFSSCFHQIA